mmetsp:Transcript_74623/g.205745  ORF Transcript_74623/g.205745 Transcript_74623/m.205745 type:complete len:339 (-) Transcript_74623:58-1074(-)
MKILQVGQYSLTNREVCTIVRQELPALEEKYRLAKDKPEQGRDSVHTIERRLNSARNVTEYLERCYPAVMRADEEGISKFLAKLADIQLADGEGLQSSEVLQILNIAPCDPVFLHGICRDCDRRFTDEQVDRICGLVRHHLLGGPPPASTDAEAALASQSAEPAENDKEPRRDEQTAGQATSDAGAPVGCLQSAGSSDRQGAQPEPALSSQQDGQAGAALDPSVAEATVSCDRPPELEPPQQTAQPQPQQPLLKQAQEQPLPPPEDDSSKASPGLMDVQQGAAAEAKVVPARPRPGRRERLPASSDGGDRRKRPRAARRTAATRQATLQATPEAAPQE